MALVLPKSVFIHVPKTGGSWVRAVIRNAGIRAEESGPFNVHDHYGVFDLPAFLVKDRFTFGFVRHPVEWLKSRWAWGMLSGFEDKMRYEPAATGHWMADCWSRDFVLFLDNYLAIHPGIATQTMLRMLGWQRGLDGWQPSAYAVDRVCRYEDLESELIECLHRAGEEVDFDQLESVFSETAPERVGANGELRAACQLPDRLRQAILTAEAPLCRLFGYEWALSR